MLRRIAGVALAALLGSAGTALAHTGHGEVSGLAAGFAHPFSGLDHMLAMAAVGFYAAYLGGRSLLALPLAFLAAMAAGGAMGMAGFSLPLVEQVIGVSVVALGLLVALRVPMPVMAGVGLVAFFAVFHGHAHGAEMGADLAAFDYGLGFLAATAILHGLGLGSGLLLRRFEAPALARLSGTAAAIAGLGLLGGLI